MNYRWHGLSARNRACNQALELTNARRKRKPPTRRRLNLGAIFDRWRV